MTVRVGHLVRHPIKSAGYECLDRVRLTEGQPFPFDRVWAVAHAAARLPEPLAWAPKLQFLRGWASPELMAIRCQSDADQRRVTLSHPRRSTESFAPDDPVEAVRLVDWLRPLWPETRPDPARVISIPGQALTDMDEPLIAINSLSSLQDLSVRLDAPLSIHRFRGNVWVDGWAPWAEREMVGKTIEIGTVRLHVQQQIGRCRAISANPETGTQDLDVLGALDRNYGHEDFGLYARVERGGDLALGDEVLTWG